MSRRKARESALKALYQLEFLPDEQTRVVEECGVKLQEEDFVFYKELIEGVQHKKSMMDPVIQRYLKEGWTLDRLSIIDRVILQIAVYELLYKKETPSGVILNEAVEMTQTYSSKDSSRFINGVLGEYLKQMD